MFVFDIICSANKDSAANLKLSYNHLKRQSNAVSGDLGCKQLLHKRAGYFLVNKPAAHDAEWLWPVRTEPCRRYIYIKQALNSGKIGWVIDNYQHMLYAKPERLLLQWIIAIAQPLFRGWGPPLRGGIVIWLARALRALGARQHIIGRNISMMTSSNGNIFRVSPVNSPHKGQWRSFDVFFDLRLNKRLSKQSWGLWFETLSRPLWRHCNLTWNMDRYLQE